MSDISRRSFVKNMGAVGVGILAAGSTAANAMTIDSKNVKYDEEYDVVIIGSGFAGLSAAITAAGKGDKVLVIEKMGRVGGNSVICAGACAIVDSPLQRANNIHDSAELYIADSLKAGKGINHVEQLQVIAERGKDVVKLLEKSGVEFSDRVSFGGGHSVARSYQATNASGSGIVLPMFNYFEKLPNGTLKKRTMFDDFIVDDSGRVVGVFVREKYKFDKTSKDDARENKSGVKKTIRAKKGVILATGGFSRDIFFRNMQDPRISVDIDSTNQPGATAEAMMKAFKLGAIPVDVSRIQFGPWGCPDEKGFGSALFNIEATFRYGISVDPKTGKRYMNELADRLIRTTAMLGVIGEDNNYPINICDQGAIDKIMPLITEKALKTGIAKKFDTLDALAAEYKIPADALKKQVAEYNAFVKAKVDTQFGKPVDNVDNVQIIKAPFYGTRGTPKLHHTMGGVDINTKAQVISSDTKEPIPGLYAAGEVTGGTHGASRLGGCSIPDCLVFGMVAGENI